LTVEAAAPKEPSAIRMGDELVAAREVSHVNAIGNESGGQQEQKISH